MLKDMFRRISSLITAVLLCLSTISALPQSVIRVYAEGKTSDVTLDAPSTSKTLSSNGDGTYDLSLSVTGSSRQSVEQTKADVIIVFDTSGSMAEETKGNTRLKTAKSATNKLVENLLKNNTAANPDSIQISLVTFATNADVKIRNSSNSKELKEKISSLKADGGTNWEDALSMVSGISTRSGAEKYIVFVSDGGPTFRNSKIHSLRDGDKGYDWNSYYKHWGTGNSDPKGWNYTAAKNIAEDLVKNKGYELYTINAFGDAGKMADLVNDAYGEEVKGHYFKANDQTNLLKAFNKIVDSITHKATYRNVSIVDPLTAETAMIPEFRYTVTDRNGNVKNDGLTVTGADGEPTTLPAASYDSRTHTVTWNLGSNYKLEDGYTYKVTFEVYPTQATLDQIAGYKNGKEYNEAVTPNITQEKENYRVFTNTKDAKVKYHVVTTENDQETVSEEKIATLDRPQMDIYPVKVTLIKQWNDTVDTQNRDSSVTFEILEDRKVIDTVTLTEEYKWQADYWLSAGIVKTDGTVRTKGHLYEFTEQNVSNAYEFTKGSTKPMYVGGELKEAKSGEYEPFDPAHTVIAGTNALKGQLEITKTVVSAEGGKPAPADAVFTIVVTMSTDQDYSIVNEDGSFTAGALKKDIAKEISLKAGQSVLFKNIPARTTYTVSESNLPEGFTNRSIEFSNTSKTIRVNTKDTVNVTNDYGVMEASKVWDDNNNQDGKRQSVTFKLMSSTDGQNFTDVADSEKTVGTENQTVTWTGLPAADASGKKLTYKVAETGVPAGYTSEVTGTNGVYTVTNTHVPEQISLSGEKTWDDNNNQDGKRPQSITVSLMANNKDAVYQNGSAVDPVTVSAADGWKYSFENVPKYSNGQEIQYKVVESEVSDYSATYDGLNIKNTHTVEKTSITVNKIWDDNNDQDGKRPASVTVNLLADNRPIGQATVTAEAGWTYTFTDLDVYANGQKIQYTVTEEAVTGYNVSENQPSIVRNDNTISITNTHVPEITEIIGTKIWDDNYNQDGKRPQSITVALKADGVQIDTTTASSPNWTYSFTDLPKYSNGHLITYAVEELNTPEGYVASVDEGTFDIRNTHEPSTVNVTGRKVWNDGDNQDGIRPASVTVSLYADGKPVTDDQGKAYTAVVSAETEWTFSFDGLPEFRDGGTPIVYTIKEDAVAGYSAEISKDKTTGTYTITNTHTPERITINGSKIWADDNNRDGIRPEYITVRLLADGTEVKTAQVRAGENGNWTYSFADVPKYANGKEIAYSVTEDTVAGYNTVIDGYTITNTHAVEKTEVTVNKIWNDDGDRDRVRPSSITVTLLADGDKVTDVTFGPDNAGNWNYTFSNLNKKNAGKDIVYTVTENPVDKYTTNITGTVITNTHEIETVTVSGHKTWNDADDQDGKRPDSITVYLFADGTKEGETVVTEASGWNYSFTGLPKYNDGKKISYTVAEVQTEKLEGYTPEIDGYNIINSYSPEKTSVSVAKVWNDNGNQDGLRTPVTINLYADDNYSKSMELSDANGWKGTFSDLPKYKDGGTEIKYTIDETAVSGYQTAIVQDKETGVYTVTNTHTPATKSISGTKTWNDNDNQDGIRPQQITITLSNDAGLAEQTRTVGEADGWTYTFTDLPVYWNGVEITYTVNEEQVEGYTGATDGVNFVNTHTPSTIELSGQKTWNDADDQDGKRPQSVTVELLADGSPALHQDGSSVEAVTVDENTQWTYRFADLPEYKDGQKISYTVREKEVDGYNPVYSEDGLNIENVHTPETYASIFGHKIWDDANNQDGKRPEKVIVHLYADGKQAYDQNGNEYTAAVTGDDWNFAFENVDKYRNGKLIKYSIIEETVDGYESNITGSISDGFTITNTHEPETTSITGHKIWDDNDNQDGKRPEFITVRLYAGDAEVASAKADINTGWAYEFTDMPMYQNGELIDYTVKEDAVAGYTADVVEKEDYTFDIINTHELETVSISGTKVWDDADDQDGIRPDTIIVHLYADGNQAYNADGTECTLTVGADSNWSFTFDNVYKYVNAREVQYTVVEETVEGYSTTVTGDPITGFTLTNSHTPETIDLIHGTKIWDDNDNQDGKRPESVTVRLYADGSEVDTREVSEASSWTYSFYDLPKFSNGRQIVYTVREDAVAGYESVVKQMDEYEFEITNVHTPETVKINGMKVWNDDDNASGKRPESITVTLLADGEKVAETTATEDLEWFFSFGELPVYREGSKIEYTIKEMEVEGYRATWSGNAETGFTLRNTLRPETPVTPDIKPRPQTPMTPNTSDSTNIVMYAGFAIAALVVILGVIILRKKEN